MPLHICFEYVELLCADILCCVVTGAWFVYPALTKNFKQETLGIVDNADVAAQAAIHLSKMGPKDAISAEESEDDE